MRRGKNPAVIPSPLRPCAGAGATGRGSRRDEQQEDVFCFSVVGARALRSPRRRGNGDRLQRRNYTDGSLPRARRPSDPQRGVLARRHRRARTPRTHSRTRRRAYKCHAYGHDDVVINKFLNVAVDFPRLKCHSASNT